MTPVGWAETIIMYGPQNSEWRKEMSTMSKRAKTPHQPVGRWIRVEKRLAIYLRDNFRCAYCTADLRDVDPADITLDHLVSRVVSNDKLTNHQSNLVTACRSCNSSRQDTPWKTFATHKAFKRILVLVREDLKPFIVMAKSIIADRPRPVNR